jgi:hypothetical protein
MLTLLLTLATGEPVPPFVAHTQAGPLWAYPADRDPVDLAMRLSKQFGRAVVITQSDKLVCVVDGK